MTMNFSATTFRKVTGSMAMLALLWALTISSPGSPLWAQSIPLLSQQMVEPYGLTRAWFNQLEIDPLRSKILHAVVEGGTMFVVTDDAKLHAIDAETGQTLWIRTLGSRHALFLEPAVNSSMVSVLNGLELFIFNRKTGKLLQQISLPGAASTGCEMSENYVYIPMMDNRIIAYPIVTVDGPTMEEEGGAGAEEASGTLEVKADESSTGGAVGEHEDSVLDNIVKEFAKARDSVMAEPPDPKKEKEIVLRTAVGIPMTALSFGTTLVKPVISSQIVTFNQRKRINSHRETLVWVSQRGFLLAAAIHSLSTEEFDLQYMIDSSSQTYYLGSERIARREWEADKELGVRPTVNQCVPAFYTENKPEASEIPSMVVCGGKAAYVFAIKDRLGEVVWQFAASGPIMEPIAIIGKNVYCCTSTGGMHALDLMDGKEQWYSPDIRQFIAASKKRLYTLDRRSRIVVLDRRTGARLNAFDGRRFDRFLFNLQTDRIYVINDFGLIQCLQERQPVKDENAVLQSNPPIYHRLTCKDYADVLAGRPAPTLYWMQEGDEDEEHDVPTGIAAPISRRKSGEDGNLDGDEMDIDVKPRKKAEKDGEEKEEKKDDDPFS